MPNISKQSPTIRLTEKVKNRLQKSKKPHSYSKFITQLLNAYQKPKKQKFTLNNHLEIKCPVLIRVDQTCYCVKKPPKASMILTLDICLVCTSMTKFQNIREMMKDGYHQTFQYPSCGGDLREARDKKQWVKCPRDGNREKLFPTYCNNIKCPRIRSKTIKVDLDLETMK